MFRPRPGDASKTVLLSDAPPRETPVREEAEATVVALLPWSISILLHAALVLVAFWVIWVVMDERTREQVVVPELTLSSPATMTMQATRQERVTQSSRSRSISHARVPDPSLATPTRFAATPKVIGRLGGAGNPGFFNPTGEAGHGDGDLFGEPTGNAETIVFLVDASGSLLDTFPFVIHELRKSVAKLSKEQSFTIIFFQGDEALEVPVPRPGMKRATAATKAAVRAWLDPSADNVRPRGATNPLPGLQLGLRYRPQLMMLLSDNITGGGTGATMYEIEQQRLLDEVSRANLGHTRISTIQFLYPDPLTRVPGKRGTLELIAEQTGGRYRYVEAADLPELVAPHE